MTVGATPSVVLFGILAMFAYPLIYRYLGAADFDFDFDTYVGSTIGTRQPAK